MKSDYKGLKCLAASGQLGYGIPKKAFLRGVQKKPDYIGVDMGSTDPGPHYLGSGKCACSDIGIKGDLDLVLSAALDLSVPLLIGSAGTAGAKPQVLKVVDMVKEIALEKNYKFKLAVIFSDIEKNIIKQGLTEGKVSPLTENVGPLTEDLIKDSTNIVAQLGVEPFVKALQEKADVIIAGRACDTSMFAAYPIMKGYDRGLAIHMAKIVECTSQCADPGGREAMMGYLFDNYFVVETQKLKSRCTPVSVAAHGLYEQPNPYIMYEPGGMLNLKDCKYEWYSDTTTKVSGSKWITSENYTLKLEGAKKTGYRAISLGGVRDPIMISQIKEVCKRIEEIVISLLSDHEYNVDYKIKFRVYGADGVMEETEPNPEFIPQEMFIVTDVVAKNEDLARAACGMAKQYLLHYYYPGILATGGNLAIPFAPDVIQVGEVYEFTLYHLLSINNPLDYCKIEYIDV